MTIIEVSARSSSANPELLSSLSLHRPLDLGGVCKLAGLNVRQCRVVRSGDLHRIRHAIELESGPTKGLFIKVVM